MSGQLAAKGPDGLRFDPPGDFFFLPGPFDAAGRRWTRQREEALRSGGKARSVVSAVWFTPNDEGPET
jgi:hypothetical protein